MNEKPHLHEVEIQLGRGGSGNGVRIVYGDTRKPLFAFFGRQPSARRVNRKVRKAVRQHDRGSLKVGTYSQVADQINSQMTKNYQVLCHDEHGKPIYSQSMYSTTSPEKWATDILKETATNGS